MNRRRALKLYIVLIGCLTVAVLVAATSSLAFLPRHDWTEIAAQALFFAALGWICSQQVVYFGDSNSIAMGTVAQIAAVIVLPLPVAILAIVWGKAMSELWLLVRKRHIRSWRAIVVNTGGTVLANAVAGIAFVLLGGGHLWDSGLFAMQSFPALIALGLLYHMVDDIVVVIAISLSFHDPVWSVFRRTFSDILLPQMSMIFVGIVFGVLWHYSAALSLFIIVPVVLSIRSFEAVARLRKETVEAVLKMAESIDYRDTGTYEHSKRIADLTKRLATSMGLLPEHISEIVLASRVHDLGKIGVSNEILLKAGPLTPEERSVIEEHPVIGANILSSYSAFQGSLTIVRHHHERWDGKGYPDGLRGEDIPLGSRLLTVVDSFDSMTADRPYRRGMSVTIAIERLKDGMGTQFDPQICAAFIRMLIDDGVYIPPEPAPDLRLIMSDAG